MRYLLVFLLLFVFSPVHAAPITYSGVYNSVNNERITSGLPILRHSAVLDKVAQDHLQDMEKNNYFAHNSSQGLEPWAWFKKENYKFVYAGENLARYFNDTKSLTTGWMNSKSHRDNILNPHYTETGIATDGNLVVQEFGESSAEYVSVNAPIKLSTK